MGKPLTQEDIDVIGESFEDMQRLSTRQKILVFLPSFLITGWVIYQYYYIFSIQ